MQRGTSLFHAQNPLHLVLAIHDALLGIMAFTEAGKIHCDINVFNLLLTDPTKQYKNKSWLGFPVKAPAGPDVWRRTANHPNKEMNSHSSLEVENRTNDESPRLRRIRALNRGPYCVVHDTEFTVDEGRTEGKVHTDRTGTPAFISAQLLANFYQKHPRLSRSFIHDVESLFWALVWVLIHRTQDSAGPWKVNDTAKDMIKNLSSNDMIALARYKTSLLADTFNGNLEHTILKLENEWSSKLFGVVVHLGRFFHIFLYFKPSTIFPDQKDQIQKVLQNQSREETFEELFRILDLYIERLSKEYTIDLGHL